MKYEAKVIPEGINTSRENPLKEMILLVAASLGILAVIIVLLAILSDFLVSFIPPETENQWFGKQSVEWSGFDGISIDQESNQAVEAYLYELLEELKSDDHSNFNFTLTLFKHETPNAFIIPGGHIFVSTALLKNVESENGLAMVLAHEMAHQYRRHPLRSAGRGIIIAMALTVFLGNEADDWLYSILSEATTVGLLVFSREQEREADQIALQILLDHYGHAKGSTEFFRNVQRQTGSSSSLPTFYQSHPGADERIEFLEEYIDRSIGELTPLPELVNNFGQTEQTIQ